MRAEVERGCSKAQEVTGRSEYPSRQQREKAVQEAFEKIRVLFVEAADITSVRPLSHMKFSERRVRNLKHLVSR
jgi:hypothetical protein